MVDFPGIVVLIACLLLIDGSWGNVTLERSKDIQFNTIKQRAIEADKGHVFCFKNRVDCVEYEYDATGDVLAFIVKKSSVSNKIKVEGVTTMEYEKGSVKTGQGFDERVDVKVDTGNFCVVFVNGPFTAPRFADARNATVTVEFEIKGCPTRYQKFVAILVPIGVVLLVVIAFSAWWIRRRRKTLRVEREKYHHGQQSHVHYPPPGLNVAHHPGNMPPPGQPNSAYPVPAQFAPGTYHVNPSNGVPVGPGQMNVSMGTLPYPHVAPATGVPAARGEPPARPENPSTTNTVWAAAAERVEAGGTNGRITNEDHGDGNRNAGPAGHPRETTTVPYVSGAVPRWDAENVADSDTRV